MFWKKQPEVPPQQMVIVDLWYHDDTLPNVLQSWTWQTVDQGPEYPRATKWIMAMANICHVHHFQIREFERPVPNYDPNLVFPLLPTTH